MREAYFMLFGLKANEYSAKGLWLLLGVFAGAIGLAAVLSPSLFMTIQRLAEASGPDGLWGYLAQHRFPRYFDRVRMLAVVISLVWLMRYCGLWSWQALGFSRAHLRFLPKWFFYGALMILLAAACQWSVGDISLREGTTAAKVLERVLTMVLAGLILAIVEESVFRGMVLRIFYTAARPFTAVVLSALFFAYVHFKHVPWARGQVVTMWTGLEVGWQTLLSPVYTFDFFTFVNLFLAGVILNLLFLRTRSLWCCVGLHAGWVALRAPYGRLVHMGDTFPRMWWGSHRVIDGIVPVLMLLIAAWLISRTRSLPSTR